MEEVILRIIDNSITGLIAVLLVWRLDRRLLELILEVRELKSKIIENHKEILGVRKWLEKY